MEPPSAIKPPQVKRVARESLWLPLWWIIHTATTLGKMRTYTMSLQSQEQWRENVQVLVLKQGTHHEGSRWTKSTWSSSDRESLDDAISKISRFTTHSMDYKKTRYNESAKYAIHVVQDLVKGVQLTNSVKLKAIMYFAREKKRATNYICPVWRISEI